VPSSACRRLRAGRHLAIFAIKLRLDTVFESIRYGSGSFFGSRKLHGFEFQRNLDVICSAKMPGTNECRNGLEYDIDDVYVPIRLVTSTAG